MKKGILLGALLLSGGMVSAQGLYVGLATGYGFAAPADVVGTKQVFDGSGNLTESNIYGSLGAGSNSSLNVGYMFGEHFGADLGLNYFIGSKLTTTDISSPGGTATVISKSNQFRIIPSFVVSSGGDLAVYARAGFIFPVAGSTVTEARNNTSGSMVEQDLESKGAFSLGYHGAFGVKYKLSDKLSIFGEMSGAYLRIKSSTRSLTKLTVDGQDQMGTATTYGKEVEFVDELNSSSNNLSYNSDASNVDMNKPREELATTTNFNGAFINIGIKFHF